MERRYVRSPSGLDAVGGLFSLLALKVVKSTLNVRRFRRFTSTDNRFFRGGKFSVDQGQVLLLQEACQKVRCSKVAWLREGGCQFSEQRGWILTSLRVHGKEHDMTGGVEFLVIYHI